MRDGSGRWRAWRRSRPFWGGLLLILAGLELLIIPSGGLVVSGAVKLSIYIGIGGVFGTLIAVLLIVSGLGIWFNQAQKTFYAIAGVLLGLASFPASNLGGFLIAMLLAIFGGAAAYAWMPGEPAPVLVETVPAGTVPVETAPSATEPAAGETGPDAESESGAALS